MVVICVGGKVAKSWYCLFTLFLSFLFSNRGVCSKDADCFTCYNGIERFLENRGILNLALCWESKIFFRHGNN